jgi:NADPH:quinone reductase
MAERRRGAWYYRQGEPDEVLQVGEMDKTTPGKGEMQVRVHASRVNPSKTYAAAAHRDRWHFPGLSRTRMAPGIIEAVGEG